MGAAALALIIANSPLTEEYFHLLHVEVAGLSLAHWVNDGLMAVFFLLVGLEIKREMVDGELSTWSRRVLHRRGRIGRHDRASPGLCDRQSRHAGQPARLGHSGRPPTSPSPWAFCRCWDHACRVR